MDLFHFVFWNGDEILQFLTLYGGIVDYIHCIECRLIFLSVFLIWIISIQRLKGRKTKRISILIRKRHKSCGKML